MDNILKFARSGKIFLLIILINFNMLDGPGEALADPRLDEFVRVFDRVGDQRLLIGDPKSPLYPYRHLHYDDGLSQADRHWLNSLQKSGNCFPYVYDLMVTGFFGLYPHLRPIMVDWDRYPRVRSSIRGSYPAMLERCVYFKQKRKLDRWFDVTLFGPVDGAFGVRLDPEDLSDPTRYFAWRKWQFIAREFGRLAFCNSYPPSIRDAWAGKGQSGGLSYTVEESIYLMGRASYHGMLTEPQLTAAIAGFRRQGINLMDIHRLLDHARSHRLHEMNYLRGNWQLVCTEWFDQAQQSRKYR